MLSAVTSALPVVTSHGTLTQHQAAGPMTSLSEQLVLAAQLQAALATEVRKADSFTAQQLGAAVQLLSQQQQQRQLMASALLSPEVQHLLIPIAAGGGPCQQLLSVPVSVSGGGAGVELVCHGNQIIATNLAAHVHGLTGPVLSTVPAAALSHQAQAAVASSSKATAPVARSPAPHNPHNPHNPASLASVLLHQMATANKQATSVLAPITQSAANSTSSTSEAPPPPGHPRTCSSSSSSAGEERGQPRSPVPSSPPSSVTCRRSHLPLLHGFPPALSHLLPNTVGSCGQATTVDGIDLEEIREFAKQFKLRRLALGLTQTQVGQALSATEGPAYSQSAICRFEKLDITPKSAQKIKPVLEQWMVEAEERCKRGSNTLTDLTGLDNGKKRKRRTSFAPQALEVLNEYFERNTHPSGSEMTSLAEQLNYDREVVRVWFCNRRQALKNTIKKLKTDHSPTEDHTPHAAVTSPQHFDFKPS